MKLEFSGGSLAAGAAAFVSCYDPSGNLITSGSGGWTFTRNGANEITITHPLGVWLVNFMTHAQQSSGDYLSRMSSGSSTAFAVVMQNTSRTTMNWKALTTSNIGIYNTGTSFAFLTWQLPTNNIYS
jgi:hypothetical protein